MYADAQQRQLIVLAVYARRDDIVVDLQFLLQAHLAEQQPREGVVPAEGYQQLQGTQLEKVAMAYVRAFVQQNVAAHVGIHLP